MTVTLTLPPDVEGAIQDAARRQGQTTEEAITEALQTFFVPSAAAQREEQRRLHDIMAELQAEAEKLEPEPPDSPTRRAARENPVVQSVVEKFRKQGFRL